MPQFVSTRVPATSANLGPGFDCLGLALGLWNTLCLAPAPQNALEVSGEGADVLAGQTDTLAHLAAHRVFDALKKPQNGVFLRLHNEIPLARGLGSSSAAIVGALVAANEWCRRATGDFLSQNELLDLATAIEGHPDNVAPALLGGLVAAATRENGEVEAVQLPLAAFPRFVAWIPGVELATKTARGVLPAQFSRADAIFNVSRTALLLSALAAGRFDALGEGLRDKIHQDYRAPLVPGWDELTRAGRENGALGATLSGAGPTILFWLAPDAKTLPFEESLKTAASERGLVGRAVELEAQTRGCEVIED